MASTRDVMNVVIGLEKETMRLYVGFSKTFSTDPKLKEFWFRMARDEAGHLGALDLVSTTLEQEGLLDKDSPVSLQNPAIVRLRTQLDKFRSEATTKIPISRALTIALELEETEIEELVADLLKPAQSEREQERYLRLLVHDLGDLSYMIEQHCPDAALLQRCDSLVNRHAAALESSSRLGS
jgi:rubrerythrin